MYVYPTFVCPEMIFDPISYGHVGTHNIVWQAGAWAVVDDLLTHPGP